MKIPPRLAFVFPLLLTMVVFWQTLSFKFVNFDDYLYITKNAFIQKGFNEESLRWAFCADLCFNAINTDYWQPMTILSRMVDMQLWGLNPHGHHASNLLIHLANVFLLYMIFLKLSKRNYWLAAWIAAAFAVHPAQSDVVPWITARKDVLSAFFGFLTILTYLRYVEKPSILRNLLVVFVFALSIMSKPMLLMMPGLLLVLDYWPLERWKFSPEKSLIRRVLVLFFEKSGLFFLSFLSFWITVFTNSKDLLNSKFYYGEIPINIFKYIYSFIYPVSFSVHELSPTYKPLWVSLLVAVPLVVLTVFILRAGKKYPFLVAGWLWFLIGLMPVLHIPYVGRYLHIAGIGFFIIMAWSSLRICELGIITKKGQQTLAVFILVVWSLIAFEGSKHWKDSLTFGEYAARERPKNAKSHNSYGTALLEVNQLDMAVREFTKALWITPNYSEAHASLAVALGKQGKIKVAEDHFYNALLLTPNVPEIHNNYGAFLANQGKYKEAIVEFREALSLAPDYLEVRRNLSFNLLKAGEVKESFEEYRKLLKRNSWDPGLNLDFGVMLVEQGSPEEAIQFYSRAIEMDPDNSLVHNSWGIALANLSQPHEAVEHFQKAIELNPQYSEAHNNLATVLASQKKWNEAEVHFKKAMELDPDYQAPIQNLQRMIQEKKKSSL